MMTYLISSKSADSGLPFPRKAHPSVAGSLQQLSNPKNDVVLGCFGYPSIQ